MDSNFFRIVVAISGLFLIAGLLLWDWLHKRALKKTEALLRQQRQQEFAEEPIELEQMKMESSGEKAEMLELPSMTASRSTAEIPEKVPLTTQPVTKSAPSVIQISVIAANNGQFDGNELRLALESLGLARGEMGIYHRHFDPQNSDRFSVASLIEPGTFPEDRKQSFETPGIVLFLEVNEQSDPLVVFDELVQTASSLTKKLDGILLNEKHQPLAEESLSETRKLLAAQ